MMNKLEKTTVNLIINKIQNSQEAYLSLLKIYVYKELLGSNVINEYLDLFIDADWNIDRYRFALFIDRLIENIDNWALNINENIIKKNFEFMVSILFDMPVISSNLVIDWFVNWLTMISTTITYNIKDKESVIVSHLKNCIELEYSKLWLKMWDTRLERIIKEYANQLMNSIK